MSTDKPIGPFVRTLGTITVCDGCKYFKRSMRSRSMRDSTDYFYCHHPKTMKNETPKLIGWDSGVYHAPAYCPALDEKNIPNKE